MDGQVHVEVPVERTVYREVPVPVYGEERVITKEVTVPVEVIKEVTVPVEHVVTKEVEVPVEIGQRSETRVGESRIVIGEETRASAVSLSLCEIVCVRLAHMILLYMFVCVHLYANEVSELLACMDTPEERERG